MAIDERVHRLSTAEYRRIVEGGGLDGVPVELLDGLLVDVSPQGERHARVVQGLMRRFAERMDLLRVQMPLAVAEGWVPEPDAALALPDQDPDRHPSTALIVVEVAVTSQAEDRRKAAVYASAGIPRFWLVDVPAATVFEHSRPAAAGYTAAVALMGDDRLDPDVDGIEPFTVDDILGR